MYFCCAVTFLLIKGNFVWCSGISVGRVLQPWMTICLSVSSFPPDCGQIRHRLLQWSTSKALQL